MKRNPICLLGVLLLLPTSTYAVFDGVNATPSEIFALPPYCIARYEMETGKKMGNPDAAKWAQALGKDMEHIHHYCKGLIHLSRAESSGRGNERAKWARYALGGFNYMLRSAKPDSLLLPEIHFNKGKAYLLLQKGPLAEAEFLRTIELNPGYTQAYSALSDYYRESGAQNKARAILEQGLKLAYDSEAAGGDYRKAPNIKVLSRRYKELSGTDYKPSAPSAVPANAIPSKRDVPVPTEDAQPTPTTPEQATAAEPAAPEQETDPPQKIGTPSNPWCRFCPDPAPEHR